MGHEGHNRPGAVSTSLNERRLVIALGVTVVIAMAEVVGGLIGNSLALVSDAGHMITDVIAIGLSLFAVRLTRRSPTLTRTFGYYRAEIMAAFANGALLVLVSAYIIFEAYNRIFQPAQVQTTIMLVIASVGLVANFVGVTLLRSGGKSNLNVRGALLHMMCDALSSIGVIVAAVIIVFTGWMVADPIASLVTTALILRAAVGLLRDSTNILLEAAPKNADIPRIVADVRAIPGAKDIHDMHVWTISSGMYALSAHILTEYKALAECSTLLLKINQLLWDRYSIGHTALQLECDACGEGPTCQLRRAES